MKKIGRVITKFVVSTIKEDIESVADAVNGVKDSINDYKEYKYNKTLDIKSIFSKEYYLHETNKRRSLKNKYRIVSNGQDMYSTGNLFCKGNTIRIINANKDIIFQIRVLQRTKLLGKRKDEIYEVRYKNGKYSINTSEYKNIKYITEKGEEYQITINNWEHSTSLMWNNNSFAKSILSNDFEIINCDDEKYGILLLAYLIIEREQFHYSEKYYYTEGGE